MKFLNKQCIRIAGIIQAVLMIILSLSFLVLSFESGDNEVLRLLGESPNQLTNSYYDKKL